MIEKQFERQGEGGTLALNYLYHIKNNIEMQDGKRIIFCNPYKMISIFIQKGEHPRWESNPQPLP